MQKQTRKEPVKSWSYEEDHWEENQKKTHKNKPTATEKLICNQIKSLCTDTFKAVSSSSGVWPQPILTPREVPDSVSLSFLTQWQWRLGLPGDAPETAAKLAYSPAATDRVVPSLGHCFVPVRHLLCSCEGADGYHHSRKPRKFGRILCQKSWWLRSYLCQ